MPVLLSLSLLLCSCVLSLLLCSCVLPLLPIIFAAKPPRVSREQGFRCDEPKLLVRVRAILVLICVCRLPATRFHRHFRFPLSVFRVRGPLFCRCPFSAPCTLFPAFCLRCPLPRSAFRSSLRVLLAVFRYPLAAIRHPVLMSTFRFPISAPLSAPRPLSTRYFPAVRCRFLRPAAVSDLLPVSRLLRCPLPASRFTFFPLPLYATPRAACCLTPLSRLLRFLPSAFRFPHLAYPRRVASAYAVCCSRYPLRFLRSTC